MDVSEYIGFVASEGKLFAAAANHGKLSVEVPSCPEWNMGDLVRHLGMVHLWAAANVAYPKDEWLHVDDLEDLAGHWPELASERPADAELVSWYQGTLANLINVLESTPADHDCFAVLPAPSPLAMWARRQASELAIHRFDTEAAHGISSRYEPEFATVMLDELLFGFAPRPRSEKIDVDGQRVLHLTAQDTGGNWWITITPQGIETSRTGSNADLTVTATTAELYLSMWNRAPDSTLQLSGDARVMDLWHSTHCIRWS